MHTKQHGAAGDAGNGSFYSLWLFLAACSRPYDNCPPPPPPRLKFTEVVSLESARCKGGTNGTRWHSWRSTCNDLGAAIGNGEGGGLGKGEVGELVTVGCDVGARVYTSVDKMDTPLMVVTPRSFAREATADASVPSDAAFATSVSHVSESSPADDAVVN